MNRLKKKEECEMKWIKEDEEKEEEKRDRSQQMRGFKRGIQMEIMEIAKSKIFLPSGM